MAESGTLAHTISISKYLDHKHLKTSLISDVFNTDKLDSSKVKSSKLVNFNDIPPLEHFAIKKKTKK